VFAGVHEVFGGEERGFLAEVVVYGDFVVVLVLGFEDVLVDFFGGGGVEWGVLELDSELGGEEVFCG
jgi:hypothetical protein